MYGKLKTADFLKFDFASDISVQTNLNCSTQFQVQNPEDPSILERAILIMFQAESEGDPVHLRCICRVIFSFSKKEDIPSEEDFLNWNYEAAYVRFCTLVDVALSMFGQKPFDFQPITGIKVTTH